MSPFPLPPDSDRALGLAFYQTSGPGTGGRIKVDPEDFRVRELSLYPPPVDKGEFTVLRVIARNWEQHELAQRLAGHLRLRPGAIAWAGTKDRRAITEQLLSFRGTQRVEPGVPFPGAEIVEAYRSDRGLVLGHHFGNSFVIRVREVELPAPELRARLERSIAELRGAGHLPNFFGPQRFGEVRPVTHLVGRALVLGDPDGAVRIYLTAETAGESTEGTAARKAYAEHLDPERALQEFPAAYRFERSLLDRLSRGHSGSRAINALPRELRRLFVHAYQSRIFNEYLSRRHGDSLSLTQVLAGDQLLRVARDGTIPGTDPIPVGEENLEEGRELVRRARAVVAGPLVGSATPPSIGAPGELLESILAAEGIERSRFDLPRTPELASEGSFRPLAIPVPPVGVVYESDEAAPRAGEFDLTFSLPKGAYATVLLRELIKPGSTPSGPSALADARNGFVAR